MGCLQSTTESDPLAVHQASYNRDTEQVQPDSERRPLLSNNRISQHNYGGQAPSAAVSRSAIVSSAKPLGLFVYLDRKYTVTVPECGVEDIDKVFKSVCERFDIAVINREKIDETLTLFKQILEVDLDTPLEECFQTWKEFLVNPQFTVNTAEASGDVKDIRVRADNIPKERRKAQKHIRDMLDACHLFLQQREFIVTNILNDIAALEGFAGKLQVMAASAHLNASQKKSLDKVFNAGFMLVTSFPETIETFWRQTYSLMHEINTSVHVLDGVPGPELN